MSEIIEFVKNYYIKKTGSSDGFEENLKKYYELPVFKINENIHDKVDYYNDNIHYILQGFSLYYMIKLFESMRIDMNDDNVMDSNFGTPYRFVKILTGKNIDDDTEILSGRFVKEPDMKFFPNDNVRKSSDEIIIKKFDVVSACSHHLAPFSTKFKNSFGFIAFKPDDKVLGLSKISRYVRYISRRGWLQEDLTSYLHKKFCSVMNTENVMVGIVNCLHLCEYIRGIEDEHSSFTTIEYSGIFNDEKIRNNVISMISK